MPALGSKCTGVVYACAALLCGILPARADQHNYPEQGTVISATIEHGYVYTIETDDNVMEALCVSLNPFRKNPPVCNTGGRPMAVHDTIQFRREGDVVYIPASGGGEERLLILSTELKVLPPLPNPSGLAPESAAVLGLGLQTRTVHLPAHTPPPPPSTTTQGTSSASTPTGPILAIPVTGGPPVEVIPTGPVTGGTITGVPITGGPPITAIPVEPTGGTSAAATSASAAATPPISSTPAVDGKQWVRFVRLQTDGKVYDLACSSKSCSLEHNPIHLGDLVTIRIEKKSAWLSRANSTANSEQKFDILDVRSIDDPPGVPPH